MKKTPIAAVYCRYSCDQQRETSIDDQLRRCREVAARHGFLVDESLIYSDSALSGTAIDKRDGYKAFVAAWEAGRFDVILVDEFSRLSRDDVEQAVIRRRLRERPGIRLITCDGTDTAQPGWELTLGIQGVLAQDEVRKAQHRVGRGMLGQLERGYMIATPAYGYKLEREFDPTGNHLGSRWLIKEYEAGIVKEIFNRRANGESMHAIARWLNETGVATARKGRGPDGGFWRPARVRGLLANRIYRGEFVWHGSTTHRYRAKKRGQPTEEKVFLRPELRLVSDEVWDRCNGKSISRSGYGGGQHALAGLIQCGCCGSILLLNSNARCRSLFCAACTVAKSVKGEAERQTITVVAAGVQLLLTEAMRHFFTPQFVDAFRRSLRDKLTGNVRHDYDACKAELQQLTKAQTRLAHMLANVHDDDPVLAARYEETRRQAKLAEARLETLAAGCAAIDRKAVAAQLEADPGVLLDGLFDSDVAPQRLRALLARLFPSIVLTGKEGPYRSHFRIEFAPGSALALATGTATVLEEAVEREFVLRYRPDRRGGSPERWSVEVVGDSPRRASPPAPRSRSRVRDESGAGAPAA